MKQELHTTWSRLASVARPEKKPLLWGLFFLLVSSLSALAFPQIIRWLVDSVLTPKRLDLLLPVVGALFLASILQAMATAVRYYLFTLTGERIVLKLRQRLYEKILSQEISFFDFNRTGDLMSRLSSDCTTLQNTVSVNVSQGLRNLGQVIGGLGFMFYTSWKLSTLMILLLLPVGLAAAVFGRKIRGLAQKFQAALAEASIVSEETISGVRTVKSFVQENREAGRYQQSLALALKLAQTRITAVARFMLLLMIVGFAAICFVLWFGGHQVLLSELTVGDLTQFMLYLMLVAIQVGSLGSLWGDLMAGIGASHRVFEILEKSSDMSDAGRELSNIQGYLRFSKVSFHYPARADATVLKEVDFEIHPGQAVAFVGPSGGGKTTIGSLLPRFYEPTTGQILLDHVPLSSLKPSWLRSQIGIVSQEPVLISSTIEENIRYAKPNASPDEIERAAKAANAWEFIQSFPEKLQTLVGEKGIQLSGGQKQRIAIARALLKDPKILILDEATSNLDTASEKSVQEALQRLMKGRTTLVIAHRLASIQNADLIFVVAQGQIVQKGTHQELSAIEDGVYFDLLQKQFRSLESV